MNVRINRAAGTRKNIRKARKALWLAAVFGAGLLHSSQAAAATYVWASGVSANWSVATNWGGAIPNAAGDIALYNSTTANGTTTLDSARTVGQLQASDAGRLWTIAAGTGALTLDNSTNTAANLFGNNNAAISVATGVTGTLALTVAAPVSLTNSDLDIGTLSSGLTVSGAITATAARTINIRQNGTAGVITLSGAIGASGSAISINNVGTSTSTPVISGVIGANVASITENSTTSQLSISGANTAFAGGIFIKAGQINLTSTTANTKTTGTGANTITLGDSAANAGAVTLNVSANGTAQSYANPINVLGGTTGLINIQSTSGADTFSGPITLANNLRLTNTNGTASTMTFSGAITGTGNLTLNATGTGSAISLTNATTGVNNTGTITNMGAGNQLVTISAPIGANVTSITQNSVFSNLLLSTTGSNTYTGPTTVTQGILIAATKAALPGWNVPGKVSVAAGATLGVRYGGTGWADADIATLLATTGNFASGSMIGIDATNGNIAAYAPVTIPGVGVNKVGGGTMTIAPVNAYTGSMTVTGGTLQLTAPGASAGWSNLSLNGGNGGILDLRSDTNNDTFVTTGATTLDASTTVNVDDITTTVLNNTLSLGTLTATGTNATRVLTVTGAHGYALSVPTTNINNNGSSGVFALSYNPTSANVTLGNVNFTTIGPGPTYDARLVLDGTTTGNTITGVIGAAIGGGWAYVTKQGAGTWTMNGINVYQGTTTINQGTLKFGVDQNLAYGLTFGAAAASTNVGTLDLTTANATFGGDLLVQTNTATANTITIGSGKTLTTNGNTTVGVNTAAGQTTKLVVTGDVAGNGTWNITNSTAAGFVQIGAATGGTNANSATMDLSGLGTFNANLSGGASIFRIGDNNTTSTTATTGVTLAVNSTITTNTLGVGDMAGEGGLFAYLKLGSGTNIINASTINVGNIGLSTNARSSGNITFNTSTGTAVIRGQTGGNSPAALKVGAVAGGNTNTLLNSYVDFSGHSVDALFSTAEIGTSNGGATTNYTAAFTFDTGTLNISTLTLGKKTSATGFLYTASMTLGNSTTNAANTVTLGSVAMAGHTSTLGAVTSNLTIQGSNTTVNIAGPFTIASNTGAVGGTPTGVVTINGGSTTVASGITLASRTSTGVVNGSLIINGGSLTVGGDIAVSGAGTGAATTTLTLNGGTLDMKGYAIGAGNAINTLTLASGTLKNVGSINAVNPITKTTAGTLTLDGNNAYSGVTTVSAGTLLIAPTGILANSDVTVAAGATFTVASGGVVSNSMTLTAEGNVNFNNPTVTIGTLNSTTGTGVVTLNSTNLVVNSGGTFGGTIQDGAAPGKLTVNNSLTLASTGLPKVSTINLANSSTLNATALAGGLSVGSGQNLTGTGTVTGTVNVASGGTVTPGLGGTETLTVTNLGATGGGIFNFVLGAPSAAENSSSVNSRIATTLMTISGTGNTLNFTPLSTFGTGYYQLISFTNPASTGNAANFTVTPVGRYVPTVAMGSDGLYLVVPPVNFGEWYGSGGNWTLHNPGSGPGWSGAFVPGIASDVANFLGYGSGTITVNAPYAVGTINLDGSSGNYTIGNLGDSTITMNNGTVASLISNKNGNNTIDAPLAIGGIPTLSVDVAGGTQLSIGGPISGASAGLTKTNSGTLVLSGANTYGGTTRINGGTIVLTGGSAISDTGLVSFANTFGTTLDVQTNETIGVLASDGTNGEVKLTGANLTLTSGTRSYGGLISGNGALVINGATQTLGNNNSYSGGTTLAAGTLIVDNSNALGNGAATVTGGTLQAGPSSPSFYLSNALNIGGSFAFAGVNSLTMAGATTLTVDPTITVNGGTTATIQGAISGNHAITKAGPGTLNLSGYNTFTGGVTLNAGTLGVESSQALGLGGTLTIAGGALQSNSSQTVNNPVTVNSNFGFTGTGTLTLNGTTTLTLSPTITVDSAATGVFGALVQGNFGITKAGPGTLYLAGTANTYTGGTTVNGGILRINADGSLGPVSGALTFTGNSTLQAGAPVTLSAGRTVSINTGVTGMVDPNGNAVTEPGIISGGGTLGVTGSSGGALTLNAANTYTGGTLLAGATLNLGNAAALNTGRLTITGGALDNTTGSAMVLANNIPMTWNGNFAFVGTNDLDMGTGAVSLNGTSKVTVNAGTLTVGGAIGGSNSLTKDGPGVLKLTAAESYTGTTAIDNGTLRTTVDQNLTGTLNFGSATTVTTTGTLDLSTANAKFGTLVAQTNSANVNTITIGSGKTLTITGTAVNVGFAIGTATQTATTKLTMTGGGSFVVNNAAAVVSVGVASTVQLNTSTTNILDLTGLSNVSLGTVAAPVTTVQMGYGQNDGGTLLLSNGTNSIAATTLNVGHSNGSNGGNGSLTLGTSTNTINADTINVGLSKNNGTIQFASQAPASPGTVTIGNKAGTGAATLVVGSNNGTGTAATITGTLDLRGHQSTVNTSTVTMGSTNNNSSGWAAGVISFDTGTFTATTLNLGQKSNSGSGSNTTANAVNLGGGTFTVSGVTTMSAHSGTGTGNVTSNLNITGGAFSTGTMIAATKSASGGGAAIANINVSGGTLTVGTGGFTLGTQVTAGTAAGSLNITGTGLVTSNSDILEGGLPTAAVTSTITLGGGTLDMTNHVIGGATPIDVLTFASGTLKNVTEINNGATGLTKTTTGTLTLINTAYHGPTAVQAGTLALSGFNPLPNSTPITVSSGATLDTTAVTDNLAAPASFALGVSQTLTNNGTVAGPRALVVNGTVAGAGTFGDVSINGSGQFAPGNGGTETAGVANLTVANNGTLSFVLATPEQLPASSINSRISASGAVAFGANTNITYMPVAGFNAGTFHLVSSGSAMPTSNFIVSNAIIGTANRYGVQVQAVGNSLDLTVTAPDWGHWQGTSGGTWSTTANWTGIYASSNSVPSLATDVANFLSNSSGTVVLNAPETVGAIVLDNSGAAYQIGATGGTNAITLNNGLIGTTDGVLGTARVDVLNGSHAIAAGLTLANPTTVTVANVSDTLTISGPIGGTQRLTVAGAGTLALTNSGNSFEGVTINSGVVTAGSDAVLGDPDASLVFAGGTLRTIAGMTIARPIAVNTTGTIDTNGFASSITGNISGNGNLTKAGPGTLTLAGPNTWGGTLSVAGGAGNVILMDANALQNATLTPGGVVFDASVPGPAFTVGGLTGANGLVLQDNAGIPDPVALTVGNNNVSSTYSGALSGPGSLTKVGTGTLTLSGNSSYTGGTNLSAGQLNINSATAIGTGPLTITGGTIDNTSGAAVTLSTNNAQNWNGNFTFTGSNDLNMGSGQVTVNADRVVTVNAGTLTVGPIDAGVHLLTKGGAGTLKFTGAIANGYRLEPVTATDSGTIEFASGSSGTFSSRMIVGRGVDANGVAGKGALTLDAGAGTVRFSDDSTVSNYIGLEGAKGVVTVNGGTLEFSGPSGGYLFIDSDGGVQNHNGDGSLILNGGTVNVGVLLGMSNVRVGQPNPPAQALDGVSTLTINSGQLNIGTQTQGAALNGLYLGGTSTPTYADSKAAGTTTVNVNLNGGTLSLDRFVIGSIGTMNVNLNGGTLQARSNDSASASFLPGGGASVYVKTGGAVVDTQGFAITIAGALIDDGTGTGGGLTKIGAGTLTLSSFGNTYYGPTTISTGTLSVGNDANLGHLPAVPTAGRLVINDGATLLANAGFVLNANRGVAVGPTGGSGSGIVAVVANQTLTIAGVIANNGAGTGGLTMAGPGTLELTGANIYTGATTVTGGNLLIASNSNLGSGPLVLNGGTLLANTNVALPASRSIAVGPAGSINVGPGSTLSFAGAISNNGATAGGLNKIGPGTLALSGTSTYTGPTTISSGTLALTGAGSIATSSVISIGSGGILDASGLGATGLVLGPAQTLAAPGDANAGPATVNGLLNAGSRPINMSSGVAGQLTFNSGIKYNGTTFGLEAVGSNADSISMNGAVTANGANIIDLAVVGNTVPGSHTLLSAPGGGLTSGGATYGLRYLNRTDWSGSLTTTNTSVSVAIAQDQIPLTAAYWAGGQVAGGLNVLALSDTNGSNWATDPGLTTISLLVPGTNADVYFPGGAAVNDTVLGADMAFRTLTFSNSAGTSISGNNTLTITPASSTAGITANENATINSRLALGAGQTWTVAANKVLNVTGNVDIGSNTLTVDGDGNTTIGSPVGVGGNASGALVKNGAGALTLTAANNLTGGITLNSGTLNVNNAAALGAFNGQAGTLTINGGTLGNTSGAPVTVTTGNNQNWNGSFAFTGTSDLNLGTGSVTINNSPVVAVEQNTLTLGGYVTGTGFTKAGNGTLVVSGTNSWSGNTEITAGTLQANTTLPPVMFTVDGGATLFLNSPVNGTNWPNGVAGSGTLRVAIPATGADTVSMSGDLSGFNGTMVIPGPGGKLQLSSGQLPTASASIEVQNGASLYLSGGGTLASTVKLFDGVTGSLNGQLQLDNGSTATGPVILLANGSVGSAAGTGTISGVISESGGSFRLTKVGGGTIVLTGANTYSGGTAVNAGVLGINSDAALGAAGAPITFTGSATLQSTTNDVILGNRSITIGANTLTFDTPFNLAVPGSISGTGRLAKTGTANLTLTGDNSGVAGSTTVTTGTLTIGAANNLPAGGVILNGTTLSVLSDTSTTLANVFTINNIGGLGDALGSTINVDRAIGGSGTNGVVTIGGIVRPTAPATGRLYVTGGDGYSLVAASLALPGGTGHDTILVPGVNMTITGNVTNQMSGFGTGNYDTLYLYGTSTGNSILGVISDSPTGNSNKGGYTRVIKRDPGTWVLGGANTYTSLTAIDQGTLRITADQNLAGPLTFGTANTVTTTGTLDLSTASATFGGALTVQTNTTAANTITIGSGETLTINGNVAIGNGANPAITATNLTVNGAGTLAFINNASGATVQVGSTANAAATANAAVLDLSGLGGFTVSLNTTNGVFRVNNSNTNNVAGNTATVKMPAPAVSNTTPVTSITAFNLNIGDGSSLAGPGQMNSVILGTGLTTLNVGALNIGTGGRDVGSLTCGSPTGSLVIRDITGAGPVPLNIGTGTANTGVLGDPNVFDVRGHNADLLFSAVNIGTQPRSAHLYNTFGFDQGTLVMDSLTMSTKGAGGSTTNGGDRITESTFYIGGGNVNIKNGILRLASSTSNTGNNAAGNFNAIGTINISGGTVAIGATTGTSINMAECTVAGLNATATINLTGGVTTLAGDIVKLGGAGTATATINLNGGTLDMTGHAIGTLTPIDNLIFATGTLQNVGAVNGAGALTKNTPGILTLAGVNTYPGNTVITDGTIRLGSTTAIPTGTGTGVVVMDGGATTAGTLDLAGLSPTVNGLSGATGTVLGRVLNSVNGTTSELKLGNGTGTFAGVIADNAGGGATGKVAVTMAGTGTQILAGANTYTGPTTINAGTLGLASTGSLANPTVTAQTGGTFLIAGNNTIGGTTTPNITIAGGATAATAGNLSLIDGSINTLTLKSATPGATVLTLGGDAGNPGQLSMDIGPVSDQIVLDSGLKVSIGAGGVNLNLTAGSSVLNGTTQTLIIAPGGGLNSGGGILFDTTKGNFGGYALNLVNSGTSLQLTETPLAPTPTTAYFKGSQDANWNTFTGGNANNSNWTSDPAGTLDTFRTPDAITDVHFQSTNANPANLATTLGRNFTIQSLTVDATATSAVSIAGGGGTLTITPANPTAGITAAAGAGPLTITAPVVLGANQTWTNNSTSPIVVSAGIAGAGNIAINDTSTGGITISDTNGPVSGYTGALTLAAGTLSLKSNGTGSGQRIAFGSGNGANLTVTGNSTLFVDRDTSATNSGNLITLGSLTIGAQNLTISGTTTVTGNAALTTGNYGLAFTGPSNITGNATFTMGTSNTAAAPMTLAGVISGAGQTITVAGPAANAPHAALRITNTSSATPNNFTGSTFSVNTGGILDAKLAVGGTDNGTSSLGTAAVTMNGGMLRLGPTLGTAIAGTTGFAARYWNTIPTNNDVSLINGTATPAATTTGLASINFPNNAGGWTYTTGINTTNMSAIWTGVLNITTPGYYGFRSQSDDGSQVYLDGTLLVNNNINHGVDGQIPYATTFLTAGPHVFVERYYQGTGSAAAITSYQGPDTAGNQVLLGSIANTVVTPSAALPVAAFPNAVTLAAGSTSTIDTGTDTSIPSLTSTGATTLNVTGAAVGLGAASNGLNNLTVTGPTAVTGNMNVNPSSANLVLAGNVGQSGSTATITKTGTGSGILTLTGNVNLAQVVDAAGTVAITPTTNLNSTVVAITGGTVDLGTTSKPVTNFAFNSGSVINGTLTGASFLKQGPGTFTLGNSTLNISAIPAVTVNQGLSGITSNPATLSTLALDFTATGAPLANIVSPTATLTLGGPANTLVAGGALSLIGKASTANSQSFASTLVDGGASALVLTAGASGSVALSLGTLTRNVGGTLDITLPTGTQSATNGVTRTGGTAGTLLTAANGTIIGTVGGNDWAANSTVSAGNIVGASVAGAASASLYTAFGANGALPANGNVDVTGTATATAAATINSIRFNAAGAYTLTLPTGVTTISTGGVLFGSTITAASTLAGGTIQPGAGGEMVFISNKPNIANVISSIIADNGSNPTSVTYRGNPNAGTTGGIFSVNANNTYTGPTYITQGRVGTQTSAVTTPFGTGANAIVYVDGNADGQLWSNQNNNIANPLVIIGNGFNEAGTHRGVIRLDSSTANTPTLSGPITMLGDAAIGNNAANTGAGSALISGNIGTSNALNSPSFTLTKVLTGVIQLSGANTYGATAVNGGTLQIGNGSTSGTLGTGPVTIAAGANLAFNRSDTITVTNPITAAATGILTMGSTSTLTLNNSANALSTLNFTAAGTVDFGNNTVVINNGGGATITGNQPANTTATVNAGTTGAIAFGQAAGLNGPDIGTAANTTLVINARITQNPNTPAVPSIFEAYNAGGGTVVLTNPGNDYPGDTVINAGVLSVANIGMAGVPSNLGTNANIHINGSTLKYTGAGEITNRVIDLSGTTGGATVDQSGTGPLKFTSNLTATGAGSKTLTLQGSTLGTGEIAGVIPDNSATNTTSLYKNGTGTWILSGANTFTGNVTINQNWLVITNSAALGVGPKTITITNGTAGSPQLHLDPSLGSTPATPIDLPANLSFVTSQNTGAITNDSGNNIIRGNITLQSGGGGTTILSNAGSLTLAGNISAGTTSRDFRVRGNGNGLISGAISNGSTVDLPVYRDGGTGAWTFSGANTYTGPTTVNAGTLRIGNASALGGTGLTLPTTDNGTNVSATGTLDLAGTSNVNETIKLSGTGNGGIGALVNTGAPASIGGSLAGITTGSSVTGVGTNPQIAITAGGGTNAAATATLGVTATSFTISGGTTVYSAAPTVTIGGGTGATATAILSGGTTGTVTGITITGNGTGFTAAPTITFSGGTVTTQATDPTGTGNDTNFLLAGITITNPGTGYTSAPTVALTSSTSTRALTGNLAGIILTGDSSIGGTGDITVNSAITESGGSHALTKVGANTLILTTTNAWTGATNINSGTVRISGAGQLPVATALTLANVAGATLDLNGNNQTIGSLAGGGTTGGNVSLSSGTLTVNGGSSTSFGGVLSGTGGGLALGGTGSLTLTNANTYTGGTTISGGTLVAANGAVGSATGPGTVTLNGGTLAGSLAGGTVAGPVLAGTGPHTIAPGAGLTAGTFGTLTLNGGLTTNSNTTLAFNLGAPVSGGLYNGDLLFVNGGLTAGA
ncbi:MAG: autotransporter-associated beta strand repeat-containing protein, partial [Tepidisphaerales bacterium]